MINIFDLFIEYKSITEDIIKALEKEEFDLLNELLEERDILIKKIDEVENKKDLKDIIEELDILELENTIKKLLDDKYNKIKINLKQVKEQKMITAKYNPKEPVDSIFVYKKL
ncbi:flagellar protein FliT [Caloramator sp.]|jgi:regulator of replication initiation timing|uniref:flagellar protein FliT n=1 Tax=Caloramator sp. TaxID=1871330 RepID=UPI0025B88C5F|nr:flagellar protein FliT [Caloramator sp.]